MKKVLNVGNLSQIERVVGKNALIVAGKQGHTVWMKNLEFLPNGSARIEHDAEKGELIIRIKMNDGDLLAMLDCQGDIPAKDV